MDNREIVIRTSPDGEALQVWERTLGVAMKLRGVLRHRWEGAPGQREVELSLGVLELRVVLLDQD